MLVFYKLKINKRYFENITYFFIVTIPEFLLSPLRILLIADCEKTRIYIDIEIEFFGLAFLNFCNWNFYFLCFSILTISYWLITKTLTSFCYENKFYLFSEKKGCKWLALFSPAWCGDTCMLFRKSPKTLCSARQRCLLF